MFLRTLIVYASPHGHTKAVAQAIGEGARQVGDNEVLVQAAEDTNPTDLEQADAVIWGSPGLFGLPAAPLKALIDKLGQQWFGGKLANKVGGTFCTTSTTHGGLEECIRALQVPMFHLGMVVVGGAEPFSEDAVRYGVPYGAGVVIPVEAGRDAPMNLPNQAELERVRRYGRRVAEIASRMAPVRPPAHA